MSADFTISGIVDVDVSPFVKSMESVRSSISSVSTDVKKLSLEIDKLGAKRASIKIDADTDKAMSEMAALESIIHDEKVSVKVDVDTGAALADLAVIEELSAGLDNKNINLKLEADGVAKTSAELAVVQAEADHLDGKNIKLDVKTGGGFATFKASAAGAQAGIMELAAGVSSVLIPSLVMLATTALPAAGVALGAGAGLLGVLSVAGLGIAAFAAFAIPSFKAVATSITSLAAAQKKIDTAKTTADLNKAIAEQTQLIKNMDPAVAQMVVSFNKLKTEYKGLAKEMQPTTFAIAAQGLTLVTSLMELAAPVAKNVGGAIKDLMVQANAGIKGDSWTTFFNYLSVNAGPIIKDLGTAFGNFITGFINLVVAFDPLTKQVNTGFLGMSTSFLDWSKTIANSEGFKQFVDWFKTEGPILWNQLVTIATALWNLGVALVPVGVQMLNFLVPLVQMVGDFAKANPAMAMFALTTGAAVIAAAPLAGAIGHIIEKPLGVWLKGIGASFLEFLAPISPIIIAIVALVIAITAIGIILALVSNKTKEFKPMWEAIGNVWDAIKQVGENFIKMLKDVYTTLLENGSIGRFQSAIHNVADAFSVVIPFLSPIISLIGVGLKGAFTIVSITIEGVSWIIKGVAIAFAALAFAVGTVMVAMSHIPGLGWMKDAGTDLLKASDNAKSLVQHLGEVKPPPPVKVDVTAPGIPGVKKDLNTLSDPQKPPILPDGTALPDMQKEVNKLSTTQYPLVTPNTSPVPAAQTLTNHLGDTLYPLVDPKTPTFPAVAGALNHFADTQFPLITPLTPTFVPVKDMLTHMSDEQKPNITPQTAPQFTQAATTLNSFGFPIRPTITPQTPTFAGVVSVLTGPMSAPRAPKITPVVYGTLAQQMLDYLTRSRSVYITTVMSTLNSAGQRPGLGGATGGLVFGPGTSTSDSINARLSTGEFIVNAMQTKKNLSLLKAINNGVGFAAGGQFGIDNNSGSDNNSVGTSFTFETGAIHIDARGSNDPEAIRRAGYDGAMRALTDVMQKKSRGNRNG